MRLLFSNRKMGGMVGGVQRAITTVMNGMVARGHEVTLLTWDQADAQAFFPISPKIRWHRLDLGDTANRASARDRLRRAKAVRGVVRSFRPHAGIGFRSGQFLVARVYSLGLGVPMIARSGARRPGFAIWAEVRAGASSSSTECASPGRSSFSARAIDRSIRHSRQDVAGTNVDR